MFFVGLGYYPSEPIILIEKCFIFGTDLIKLQELLIKLINYIAFVYDSVVGRLHLINK